MARPIPDGYHTINPHLVISDCAAALAFYEKAFGAEILARSPGPGGKIMHAAMRIGDSIVMMNDEFPEMQKDSASPTTLGGTPVTLNLYCTDVDAWFARAVEAGAVANMPPADMFWGDRYARITDPFGHSWALATRIEDLTQEEQEARGKQWVAQNRPE